MVAFLVLLELLHILGSKKARVVLAKELIKVDGAMAGTISMEMARAKTMGEHMVLVTMIQHGLRAFRVFNQGHRDSNSLCLDRLLHPFGEQHRRPEMQDHRACNHHQVYLSLWWAIVS